MITSGLASGLVSGCSHTRTILELDSGVEQLSVPMQFQQTNCVAPPCGDAFDGVLIPGTRGQGWLGEYGVRMGLLGSLGSNLWWGLLPDVRFGLGSATTVGPFTSSVHPGAYRGQTGLGTSSQMLLGLPLELRWDLGRFYNVYGDVEPAVVIDTGPGLVAPGGATSAFSSPAFSVVGDVIFRVGVERELDFGRYGIGLCVEADALGFSRGALLTLSLHFGDDHPYQPLR